MYIMLFPVLEIMIPKTFAAHIFNFSLTRVCFNQFKFSCCSILLVFYIALLNLLQFTDIVYFVHLTGIRTVNSSVSKQQPCILSLYTKLSGTWTKGKGWTSA